MAKNENKAGRGSSDGIQRISTVANPDQSGPGLFLVALGLIFVAGIAGTVFFATNRESNIGVAPEANLDHWHSAYLIHDCGVDLPATNQFEAPGGVHTHGDGILHIHPFNPGVAGGNATLGAYFEASDSKVSDDSFTTGFADVFRTEMSEANGCDGEDAQLQLAVWRNAFDETAEPEIITEDIADFQFSTAGMAITLALLPEGAEIPRPPLERIAQLSETGPGGPIDGVDAGENPIVVAEPEEAEEDTGTEDDGGAEEVSTEDDSAEDEATEDGAADEEPVEEDS